MANLILHATLALMAFQTMVHAYPTGAPPEACVSLNPTSHGPSTAVGPAPFQVTFSPATYQPKQTIKVTLSGTGGAQFKGFIIQGRVNNATDPIGFFKNPPSTAQIRCVNATGNAITHTNNTVKSSLTFDWEAPSKAVGNIVFNFTVVRGGAPNTKVDAADYFMAIVSKPLVSQADAHLLMQVLSKSLSPIEDNQGQPLIFEPEVRKTHVLQIDGKEVVVEEIGEEEYH